MRRVLILGVALMTWAAPVVVAAEQGVDEMFQEARTLGFAGRRDEARAICERILDRSPGYHDVRVFYARLFAWDRRYDEARSELRKVTGEAPDHTDAWRALADVETWSGDPHAALQAAKEGLARHPGDAGLLVRKARALDKVGLENEALATAREAHRADPDLEEAGDLLDRLELPHLRNKIGVEFDYDWLDDKSTDGGSRSDPDDWRRLTVDYTRRFGFGSVIWRVASAWQFDDRGMMYEVDAYPRLGKGRYLYLNAGHGTAGFLPELRLGAEYFQGLPRSLEFSLGVRYLDFDSSDVTIWTGTFGAYRGDWFMWVRPFVSNKDDGTSVSGNLHARRYRDKESYIEFMVGGGSSPETETDAQNQVTDTIRQDTLRARVGFQQPIAPRWILSGEIGWREEEFTGFDRTRWSASVGIERLF